MNPMRFVSELAMLPRAQAPQPPALTSVAAQGAGSRLNIPDERTQDTAHQLTLQGNANGTAGRSPSTPDRTERLLNRAARRRSPRRAWYAAVAVAGLEEATRRSAAEMVIGAGDETGQEKHGAAGGQAAVHGCAGKVANGINTVQLPYVREATVRGEAN
jgi:hypothetical protein